MKGLITLPYEVLSNIVSNVDFDDIVNLGRSCKFFQYLHTEESICKSIVQVSDSMSSAHVSSRYIQPDINFQLLTQNADENSLFQ